MHDDLTAISDQEKTWRRNAGLFQQHSRAQLGQMSGTYNTLQAGRNRAAAQGYAQIRIAPADTLPDALGRTSGEGADRTGDSGMVAQKRGILGKLPRLDAVLKEGARIENPPIDHDRSGTVERRDRN